MKIRIDEKSNSKVAIIESSDQLICDVQSALDLMMQIPYEYNCNKVIIKKETIAEEFFDLKTKIAGEILQKFTIYQIKIAIIGDFEGYQSKSLHDFIYECNQGKHIFFLKDEQEAIERLHSVI